MELISVIMSGFQRIFTPFPFSTLDHLQVSMSCLCHITLKHNKAITVDGMVHTLCTCLTKNVCGCGCVSQTLYFTTFISHKIDNTCGKEPIQAASYLGEILNGAEYLHLEGGEPQSIQHMLPRHFADGGWLRKFRKAVCLQHRKMKIRIPQRIYL